MTSTRTFSCPAFWLLLTTVTSSIISQAASSTKPMGNLSPQKALEAFETEPGFVVELVAAEPLVVDPVALAFDEQERLFVAEDRDYPTGSPDGHPLGVIALLEDTDHDGAFDKRSEFATGLKFPNGVMCWRGGVIVTASPDVWWLCDTNGDGRADVKELLLTGLDTSSTSQLRANDPTLGPDGWVYLAGGLRGGKVTSPKRPGVVVDTDKGDLRFKPDTGELELVAGKSQFGLAFDDAGNRFACMNRIQSQHAPLPVRYLERNPFVVSPGVLQNCPEIAENTLMTRYTAGAARYYPISANLTTADSHFGTYSAACAVHVYRGDALPVEYRGAAFSCDPTGNLVRGDRLEKVGGTFAALRIHERTEALRSRDNWFRPVFLADGPDGALYVADMYRKTIEHPEYLPGEIRKHTDFESGKGMGRVWRLRGAQKQKTSPRMPRLAQASGNERVRALSSSTPWIRDTAFRLLWEKADSSVVPALQKAFRSSTAEGPAVAELRLLHLLRGDTDTLLLHGMNHPLSAVRQNAVLLSETRTAQNARLREVVLNRATDPDPHVRFQVALSLGNVSESRKVSALAHIATLQADDRWTRAAILCSLQDPVSALTMLKELSQASTVNEAALMIASEVGRQTGQQIQSDGSASATLNALEKSILQTNTAFRIAAMGGLAETAMSAFQDWVRVAMADAASLFAAARARVMDSKLSEMQRLQSIRLLAFDDSAPTRLLLRERLKTSESRDVQTAAARSLLRSGRVETASDLLVRAMWDQYAPALRQTLLATLAGRGEFAGALLSAVESGVIPTGLLTPGQRDALRKSKDPLLKARAEKILAAVGGDRQRAFEDSKSALKLLPVSTNGRAVFERACSVCHRLNQQGIAVGPDLFDIRQQPKESILYHIVIPEAEIAPNFVSYECELKDGRSLSGLLATESASSITLRMAQGIEEVIPRSRIQKLSASPLSLMPQELEKTMTLQELADLLSYLRGEQ